MSKCFDFFGDIIHGAKGSAVLGEGIPQPRIFKGHKQNAQNQIWQYKGAPCDAYQVEHDLLFDAIRNNKPYNETERCAKSCLTAIMGRMACESGKVVTLEEAMNSSVELAPGVENITVDSKAPVMPDAQGNYPVAVPGQSKVL
jgi:myo-inositol 2-dehydrogenase/D-chiro-inositol 1-dehydrogenase